MTTEKNSWLIYFLRLSKSPVSSSTFSPVWAQYSVYSRQPNLLPTPMDLTNDSEKTRREAHGDEVQARELAAALHQKAIIVLNSKISSYIWRPFRFETRWWSLESDPHPYWRGDISWRQYHQRCWFVEGHWGESSPNIPWNPALSVICYACSKGECWSYLGAMGKKGDPAAVVDSKAHVFGVQNLRVIDLSSMMPFTPPGHTYNGPYLRPRWVDSGCFRWIPGEFVGIDQSSFVTRIV